jgi:hypothetical protein
MTAGVPTSRRNLELRVIDVGDFRAATTPKDVEVDWSVSFIDGPTFRFVGGKKGVVA